MPFVVQPMELEDIPAVTAIERQSFTTPWPIYAYRRELKDNRNGRYIVVRWLDSTNGVEAAAGRPIAAEQQATEPGTAQQEQRRPQGGESSVMRRAVSRLLPFWRQTETGEEQDETKKGTVVGYAGLWLVLDEGHITTIAVRPDFRGQGLGELMLIRLIEIAQEIGVERMTLEVRVSNEVAQNLYRKYSFKIEGVRRRYYSDDNEDAYIMWSDPINSPEFRALFDDLHSALRRRLGNKLVEGHISSRSGAPHEGNGR